MDVFPFLLPFSDRSSGRTDVHSNHSTLFNQLHTPGCSRGTSKQKFSWRPLDTLSHLGRYLECKQFYQQLEGDDVTILGPSSEVLGDFSRCVVRLLSIFPNKYCICCIIHFKTTMPVTTLKKEMSEPLPALCRAPPRLCKPQIGAKGHSITKRHHSKSSAKFIIFVPLILMVSFTSWAPSPVKV